MSTRNINIGPFSVCLNSTIPRVLEAIDFFYKDFSSNSIGFADFHISLKSPTGIRHFVRPQVNFFLDNYQPFKPLPLKEAYPLFEWGLNWCISSHAHQYLLIHSAVIEKNGVCVIMPAPPRSGKSTLCAALVNRGWRLFSDEFALIALDDGLLTPLPRPVSLKDQSISIIKNFAPHCMMGPTVKDTNKGSVAQMKAPIDSIINKHIKAPAKFIIYPEYKSGSKSLLTKQVKGKALLSLIDNSFNYSVLAKTGFHVATRLVEQCDCYDFKYSNLDDAIKIFEQLVGDIK